MMMTGIVTETETVTISLPGRPNKCSRRAPVGWRRFLALEEVRELRYALSGGTALSDNEQNEMFLTLFELVRDQQKIVDETAMLSQALYRAIVETMPGVELEYSKHRRKIDQAGQLKLNAQRLWNLEAIIAELKKEIALPPSGESVRSEDKLIEKLDQLLREPPPDVE